MRTIQEALTLDSPDEIRKEIAERRNLIRQMVGWLYPSILTDEIIKLDDKLAEVIDVKFPDQRKVAWQ